jgi:hypothetical protein
MSSGVSASGAAGHGWARWLAVVVAAIVAGLGAWAEWFSWVLSRQGPGGQTLGAALIAGAAAAAGYVLAVRRIRPTVLAALVIGVVGLPAASAHWIVTEYWAEYGAVRSIDIQIEAFVPSAPAETREAASNADEFVEEWCLSFAAMTRAIGNPDTAADSELSASLDAAIEAGDQAGLDKMAFTIRSEIAAGRSHAVVAAGWAPGSAAADALDDVLAAFEAMVEAKRVAADQGLQAADAAGQAAFEAAGALAAWDRLRATLAELPEEAQTGLRNCDKP